MKTEVKFPISNPIPFTAEASYAQLGITTCMEAERLTAIKTVVEHHVTAGHDEIVSEARARLVPLMTLIEYGSGVPVTLGEVHTRAVEPASPVAIGLGFIKVDATIFRKIPMPPVQIVESLMEASRKQVYWLLLAQKTQSPIDRIQYLYMVLEQEEKLTAQTPQPYSPSREARYLRNAVSHPEIDDPRITKYLQQEIQATRVDPSNESHIRFLEKKVPLLLKDAQAIVAAKIPEWW